MRKVLRAMHHIPPLQITDKRLHKIIVNTWKKLPKNVRNILLDSVLGISEVSGWDNNTEASLTGLGIEKNYAKVSQVVGLHQTEIKISIKDCGGVSNQVIAGALLHELGHAYQVTLTPNDIKAIEKAGDELPALWGFENEIAKLTQVRKSQARIET